MTNRKSHTHFRLVPKSTLDDLERPKHASLGTHYEKLNEVDPYTVSVRNVFSFWQYKVCADICGVPWTRGIKRQLGC